MFVILILFFITTICYGEELQIDSQAGNIPDSLQPPPAVMDTHIGWEKAVALPGLALYAPIKYSVQGFGK